LTAALPAWAREPEPLLLAALVIWSLVPFAVLLPAHNGVFVGSDGLQVDDHLQYLAWVRDSGEHLLFSNQFDVVHDPHLFFHPMLALSGLLWKLGVSLQLAYIAWKPFVVAIVFVGFAAYVRRMVGPGRAARAAALGLALFYLSLAAPLAEWLGGSPVLRFGTLVVGLETYTGGYVWGAGPGAVAVALMPLFLLGVERLLEPPRRDPRRSMRWYALWTGVAGMFTSWLHPWQGLTLLLIVGGLVAWGRFERRYLSLAVPVALTVAPIAYYFALSHTNSSWQAVSQPNGFPHFGSWLILGLAPAALALPGFLGRADNVQERIVRLWPFAAILVYFALRESWFYHAFAGLSLPLAVLAVRGWQRFRLPRPVAVATCLALTLPGGVFAVQKLVQGKADHFFTPDENRALVYLNHSRRPGPVLAPQDIGVAVPAFTGRNTWVGHYNWTPDYEPRKSRAEALFDGRLRRSDARQLVRESKAAFLLSDCRGRTDLKPALGSMLLGVRRFGCAAVYEVRPS
jgi:hypothetical protein